MTDCAGYRMIGRSGRWYRLDVSLVEPEDTSRAGQAVVVIAPMGAEARARILVRLYGLSSRERAVLARLAAGESTRQAAAALGVSPYTVQAHVDNACAKVGVRGRRALVARIFLDAATRLEPLS